MNRELPVGEMTITEKLAAMEELWAALCETPAKVPSPLWHGDVLAAREQSVEAGTATFSEVSAVRERMRDTPR